jgi:hypothetical protein
MTYFIDSQWIYHEVLLAFEHISSLHIEQRLTKVVQDVVVRHELKERLYAVTNDNVFNNLIMHTKLNRLLRINRMFDEVETNVHDVKWFFCLVIQLMLQEFLSKIRIKSNANFKNTWNNKHDKAIMKKEEKEVSFILTKVSKFIFICLLVFENWYDVFRFALFQCISTVAIFERRTFSKFNVTW